MNSLDPQPHSSHHTRRPSSSTAPEGASAIDPHRFAAHVRARAAADEKIRARQFRNEIRDRKRLVLWVAGILGLGAALLLAALR